MSKEIDIDDFKKSWKEQDNSSVKFSQEELLRMLNKRSSNNIKYIVIISIVEFIVLFMSLFFTAVDMEVLNNLDSHAQEVYIRNNRISQGLIFLNGFISILFIFYFYKCYKKINILNSTKDLINNILNFRRSVNLFIFINVGLGLLTLFLTGFYDFISGVRKSFSLTLDFPVEFQKIHTPFSSPEYIFWFSIICVIIIFLIIIYYSLVYGILLRRLKKNLRELRRYENQNI